MKHLYLVRHAKASKDIPGISDFERPLTLRGRSDAPAIGKELVQMKIFPDLIISSPATRTITTARLLADQLNYPKNKIRILEDLYEPWVDDLLSVIQSTEADYNKVMVVGHNPSLLILADLLADCNEDHLPTCGVIGMKFDISSWKDLQRSTGAVDFFIYPKALKGGEHE